MSQTNTSVMGIDPGVNGGVAVLNTFGVVVYLYGLRPDMNEDDVAMVFHSAATQLKVNGGVKCFMEKVGYIRGDGGKGAFTFGKIVGLIRGVLIMKSVIVYDVYPMMWQGHMECLSGGNKNVTKKRALQLFPNEHITHATADALLIAEYGRRRLLSPSTSK